MNTFIQNNIYTTAYINIDICKKIGDGDTLEWHKVGVADLL